MDRVDVAGLFSDLIRLETELWDAVDRRLRDAHGLPLSRLEFMQVIARTPGCRVTDIVEALSLTVGGASKLVDRMEDAGLCERRPDPQDRRASRIVLTPAGRRALADATPTFRSELEVRLGSAVSPEALAQFAATVRQLRRGLPDRGETRTG